MGILDELLAGGQRQQEYSDFVDRYEQGHPSQGYSDQEVLKRYGEVSHAVPSDQYALGCARGAEQAVAGRASDVREDAAGPSRVAWRNAAGKGGARAEGTGPSYSPICTRSRGSSGICWAVTLPSLGSKRQQIRSPTSCHPRWPRPCSRASRPWWLIVGK